MRQSVITAPILREFEKISEVTSGNLRKSAQKHNPCTYIESENNPKEASKHLVMPLLVMLQEGRQM